MIDGRRQLNADLLQPEFEFTTSRSSGPGGQNVNKVNSKVTLRFSVDNSRILTQEEKDIIRTKLSKQISQDGTLQVTAQEARSQFDNKEAAITKFDKILKKAFEKRKTRKRSKPTKAAVQKRLESKKRQSEKKKWRRL